MFKKMLNEDIKKIKKIDIIILIFIITLYGILSFYKLGDTKSVQTFYEAKQNEEIIIELEEETNIIRMRLFMGRNNGKFNISFSNDNINYKNVIEQEPFYTFAWQNERIIEKCKYIKLEIEKDISIGEIGFYDNNTAYIPIKRITSNNIKILEMTDEKEIIPKRISYMNSAYFDEYYFARAAYEYTHNLSSNEWTHPPLGKVIQAIPLFITKKMTPFNYRLMGNISGIILVGVMYIFGAILFKKRKYAITSSLLMALDTFHFAQTRMGTVDSHLVLFIVLAIMLMYLFINNEKTKYLVFSGIFFALSISVKWTGFYSGIVLASLYFYYLIKNKKINLNYIIKGFSFFVFIPIVIYISTYLLFPNNYHKTNNIKNIIAEQKEMYKFHSNNKHEHPFSSKWYTWPISYKPVWMHTSEIDGSKIETISGVGNLIIWICGIVSVVYMFILVLKKKDKISIFILLAILSLWLPYVFIKRGMFLYHYFPVLPFLFLGVTYLLKGLREKFNIKFLIPAYIIISAIFFIIYYPIVSGKEISNTYANKLEIFDTWIFTNE